MKIITYYLADFAVPGNLVKIKEYEKIDKHLKLTREKKKKLWTMRVTKIPVIVPEIWGDLLSLGLQWKPTLKEYYFYY